MSYTTLLLVPEKGELEAFAEYQNSNGSGPFIWNALCKKYLNLASWIYLHSEMKPLWDLYKTDTVDKNHRIALMTTFDKIMVRRENLIRTAEALEAFVEDFPPNKFVCSLLDQAKDLRKLSEDARCFAACWIQTSISGDAWWPDVNDEDEDEDERFWDISKDKGHWFLFDELK